MYEQQIEAAKEQVLRNAEGSDGCEADLMELYDECVNGLENEIRAFYRETLLIIKN